MYSMLQFFYPHVRHETQYLWVGLWAHIKKKWVMKEPRPTQFLFVNSFSTLASRKRKHGRRALNREGRKNQGGGGSIHSNRQLRARLWAGNSSALRGHGYGGLRYRKWEFQPEIINWLSSDKTLLTIYIHFWRCRVAGERHSSMEKLADFHFLSVLGNLKYPRRGGKTDTKMPYDDFFSWSKVCLIRCLFVSADSGNFIPVFKSRFFFQGFSMNIQIEILPLSEKWLTY